MTLAWVFFRIDSLSNGIDYLMLIFSDILYYKHYISTYDFVYWKIGALLPILLIFFFCIEWIGRKEDHPLSNVLNKTNPFIRNIFYLMLLFSIYYSIGNEKQFIYFQF